MTLGRHFRRFLVVGAIGFLVDACVLAVLFHGLHVGLLAARLLSFGCAVTVTWLLNRHYTFAERRSASRAREWTRYTAVNGLGALINLGVFLALAELHALFASWPLLALAVASAVALFFNFAASRALVFHGRES